MAHKCSMYFCSGIISRLYSKIMYLLHGAFVEYYDIEQILKKVLATTTLSI